MTGGGIRDKRRLHPGWRTVGQSFEEIEDKVTAWRLIARAHRSRGLTLREFKVLMWRFGFLGDDPLTLAEVGVKIGRSAERVRSIEWRALERLRRAAGLPSRRYNASWEPQPQLPAFTWEKPPLGTWEAPPAHGTLQLTCDVCYRARFKITVQYRGDRPVKVGAIRRLGRGHGWTHIAGTDRCPLCSQAATPKAIGDGAGGDQGDEQHA